jgi:hypothetical protein
MFKQS